MSLSKQRFHSFYLHELILKMPTNQISLSVCKQYTLQKSGWLCGRGSVTCICNLTSLYSLIIVAEFSEPLASLQDTGKAKRIRYITRFSLVFTAVSVLSQPVLLNCQGLNLSLHRSIFMSRWVTNFSFAASPEIGKSWSTSSHWFFNSSSFYFAPSNSY